MEREQKRETQSLPVPSFPETETKTQGHPENKGNQLAKKKCGGQKGWGGARTLSLPGKLGEAA
jgi:hypothetical protein